MHSVLPAANVFPPLLLLPLLSVWSEVHKTPMTVHLTLVHAARYSNSQNKKNRQLVREHIMKIKDPKKIQQDIMDMQEKGASSVRISFSHHQHPPPTTQPLERSALALVQ